MQYDSFEEMMSRDPIAAINLLAKMTEAQKDGEEVANHQAAELGYPHAETHTLAEGEQNDLALKVTHAIHKEAKTRFDADTWQTALMITLPLLMRHYVPKTPDGKGDYDVDIRLHATVLEAALIIAITLTESTAWMKDNEEEIALATADSPVSMDQQIADIFKELGIDLTKFQ